MHHLILNFFFFNLLLNFCYSINIQANFLLCSYNINKQIMLNEVHEDSRNDFQLLSRLYDDEYTFFYNNGQKEVIYWSNGIAYACNCQTVSFINVNDTIEECCRDIQVENNGKIYFLTKTGILRHDKVLKSCSKTYESFVVGEKNILIRFNNFLRKVNLNSTKDIPSIIQNLIQTLFENKLETAEIITIIIIIIVLSITFIMSIKAKKSINLKKNEKNDLTDQCKLNIPKRDIILEEINENVIKDDYIVRNDNNVTCRYCLQDNLTIRGYRTHRRNNKNCNKIRNKKI